MKNDKLKSYASGLVLVTGLSVISVSAQTGRRQERQIESQQQRVVQVPDQRQMPQRQAQVERRERQDRWDDRQEGRFNRLADKLEKARERQELQHIRQLDRQRQLRYQSHGDNRVVGYFDRFGQFHAVGYYDRFGNFWRYR